MLGPEAPTSLRTCSGAGGQPFRQRLSRATRWVAAAKTSCMPLKIVRPSCIMNVVSSGIVVTSASLVVDRPWYHSGTDFAEKYGPSSSGVWPRHIVEKKRAKVQKTRVDWPSTISNVMVAGQLCVLLLRSVCSGPEMPRSLLLLLLCPHVRALTEPGPGSHLGSPDPTGTVWDR